MKKLLIDGYMEKNSIRTTTEFLLNAIKKIASAYELKVIVPKDVFSEETKFEIKKVTLPIVSTMWRNIVLPVMSYSHKNVPIYFPNAMVPNFIPASSPVITSINEVLPPNGVSAKEEKAYRRRLQASIYSSDLIFVPTEYHKKILTEQYELSSAPTVLGIASVIEDKYLDLPLSRNSEKYFYVQINDKNTDGLNELLKMFIYSHTTGKNKTKLYIAGDLGKVDKELAINIDVAEKIGAIRGYNNLSDAQRASLIRGAIAMLLPSRNWKLPIVVLDAMKSACPVVVPDVPIIREISEDAVIYADVRAMDDYRSLLDKLEYDQEFRKNIIYKGIYREKNYSWEKSAQIFLESLESC